MSGRQKAKRPRRGGSGERRGRDPRSPASRWGWLRSPSFLLFVVAFALRLLFWQATPDRDWSHSVYYKGDAPTWMAYARALELGQPFELGLPLRPPGNGYLLAALGAGGGEASIARAKLVWCGLGALAVVLLHGAVRRIWGAGLALWVGGFCAVSSGLMVLSTSLNNETPYLLLVAATLRWWPGEVLAKEGSSGKEQVGIGWLAFWGGLQALACLFRVEHILVFGLTTAHLAWLWLFAGREWVPSRLGFAARRCAGLGIGFVLVLLPWQLHAWQQCRDFNRVEPAVDAATEQAFLRVEQAVAGIEWSAEARAEALGLPAASRRTMRNFVAATVLVRGGQRVEAGDVERILVEAFGTVPRPIGETPLIALYGGLNFYLAHHPLASAGFARWPLDQPPPLEGGAERYPMALVAGLPPPDLALTYPPHLEIVNRGYALGLEVLRADPGRAFTQAANKLGIFWQGVTLGVGGYDLPWGFAGPRRRVDLLVPEPHAGQLVWQLVWLGLAGVGFWHARRTPALVPWLAFFVGKLVADVAFFGYARHGATVIPVVVLLAALGLRSLSDRWPGRPRLLSRPVVPMVAMALVVLLELIRCLAPPTPRIDGRPVGPRDPWPLEQHEDRRVDWG